MPFEIVRNDITNMQVDAIVNAASRHPRVNAGVDSAIHKKAGPALLEARKEIGYIQPGSAAITPAFNLDAENVIHAATPHLDGWSAWRIPTAAAGIRYVFGLGCQKQLRLHCIPSVGFREPWFPQSKGFADSFGFDRNNSCLSALL